MQRTCSQCETILPRDSQFCPRCGTPMPGDIPEELLASSSSDPTGMLDRLREATEGEFTIIRELGRGGMGRVMLAHEIGLDRRVAMKVLPPALADHAEIVQRFQREARTAGKLSHPNIVSVYQVYERGQFTFFTMPYVAGPSLRQVMRKTPQLPFELARRYLREAGDALGYAHGKGVIHRDIKPENMLLEGSRDGRLMLTDFGIAKALGVGTTLTRPGDMMGTPYYMSPEQCSDKSEIDPRSDQYSLGLVGYEMLAGKFPLTADSLAAIVYRHLHEYPEPLEQVRPDVPDDLREVIWRAIQKDKDERFPTMASFLAVLGTPSAGPLATLPTRRPGKGSRGRRPLVLGTAAAIALAAGSGGFLVWKAQSGPDDAAAQLAELTVPTPATDSALADGVPEDGSEDGTGEAAGTGDPRDTGTAEGDPPDDVTSGNQEADRPDPAVLERQRLQRRLVQARTAVNEAWGRALEAGASEFLPDELADLNARRQRGEALARGGDLGGGVAALEALPTSYDELARRAEEARATAQAEDPADERLAANDTAAAGTDREEAGGDDTAGDAGEPATGDDTPGRTPEEEIRTLIERYRQAFEAEDLAAFQNEVYRGPIPETGQRSDAGLLKLLFDRGERYQLTLEDTQVSISGSSASVRFNQRMEYVLDRTGEKREIAMRLELLLERTDGGWRLTSLRN